MDDIQAATAIADLAAELVIPEDGTLSRVLFKDDDIRLVLFGFDTGQELTEHTASMPAILQIISGQAQLGLGEDTVTVGPGSWVHMPAHLPHSVLAEEPTVLILTLIRK